VTKRGSRKKEFPEDCEIWSFERGGLIAGRVTLGKKEIEENKRNRGTGKKKGAVGKTTHPVKNKSREKSETPLTQ